MEKKIQNLCNFIETDLIQISTDETKLKYFIEILRMFNVTLLKSTLKSTFPKDVDNEKVCESLCKDFCINYDLLKEIPPFHEKVHKYISYFKLILYV